MSEKPETEKELMVEFFLWCNRGPGYLTIEGARMHARTHTHTW